LNNALTRKVLKSQYRELSRRCPKYPFDDYGLPHRHLHSLSPDRSVNVQGRNTGIAEHRFKQTSSCHAVAGIRGANILIITLDRCSCASAPGARIIEGAKTPVITRFTVVFKNTSRLGVTGIIRAQVTVDAFERSLPHARAPVTQVCGRAFVIIITRVEIIDGYAPHIFLTGIGGAGVPIITGQFSRPRLTLSAATTIIKGAWVTVITGIFIGDVDAAQDGVTPGIRTRIGILAA